MTISPNDTRPEDVHLLMAGLLTTMHERHLDMVNPVKDLPRDALRWTPELGMSTLAGLVRTAVFMRSWYYASSIDSLSYYRFEDVKVIE